MTRDDIDSHENSSIVIMLNRHNMKLSCKYICLYSEIIETLSLCQRSLYLKSKVVIMDMKLVNMLDIGWLFTSLSNTFSLGLRSIVEKEAENLELDDEKECCEMMSTTCDMAFAIVNSQQ